MIFDLDDTLVHSDAVREAFACVARERGIDLTLMTRTLDTLPGRPARDIFEALGLRPRTRRTTRPIASSTASTSSTARCRPSPTTTRTPRCASSPRAARRSCSAPAPHPSARARCSTRRAGTRSRSSSARPTRAARAAPTTSRSPPHAPDAPGRATRFTVGDSPADMRLGAEHGVPVRIGIDRDGDPQPLLAAGATHVVARPLGRPRDHRRVNGWRARWAGGSARTSSTSRPTCAGGSRCCGSRPARPAAPGPCASRRCTATRSRCGRARPTSRTSSRA